MTDTKPPETSRRASATLIAAVVTLVLIVVVAAIVWWTRSDQHDTSTPPTSAPGTSSTAGGSSSAQGFAAPDVDAFGRRVDIPNNPAGQPLTQVRGPLTAGDPRWLTAAPLLPEQGGWQRVYNVSVPFSISDGPTAMVDGVPTGYSHTPQGAALAAVYVTWESYAQPRNWALREHMQVMTAEDKTTFDQLVAAGKVPEHPSDAATKWLVAPDAFKVETWSQNGDLCVLRLATKAEPKNGAPQWASSQVVMVWDGQWRMRLADDHQLPKTFINSLSGWTTW
ncbi:hypothetical protein [Nocardia yamanashiensis]|uniref:hypothetical protein n=1 Tax=Nocardia yamanashiensis TaxID=209247 RepID=UPI000830E8F3|nr:hypothetical protein [Nocardia yamanashiensis]